MHSLHTLFILITQQLGDYGHFSDSGRFCNQGNLFSDFKSRITELDLTPRQQVVVTWGLYNAVVVDSMGLSLPNNPAFNSLLASLFARLTNAYLVTRVVRYRQGESVLHIILCLMSNGLIRPGIGHHR